MMERREFTTAEMLSVYTGKQLGVRLGQIFEVIDFMEGYPHMLGEFADGADRLIPKLEEQFPWLKELGEVPSVPKDPAGDLTEIIEWLAEQEEEHGATVMVEGRGSAGPEIVEVADVAAE